MIDLQKRLASLSPEKLALLRARLLEREEERPAAPPLALPILEPRPEERGEPFPLTEVQQAYWIGRSGLHDLSGSGATNSYMEYELTGATDAFIDSLEGALQEFVTRHDMLRSIVLPDGRQQVLAEVPPFRIVRSDLRGRSSEAVEEELRRTRERMSLEPAPIDRWPLFEVQASLLEDQQIRLQIRFDTLLQDGRSRSILLEEVPQLLRNSRAEVPHLVCTYRDTVIHQPEIERSELYHRSRDYWLARLADIPPGPELPLAVDPGPRTPLRLTVRDIELLPTDTWRRLKEHAAQRSLTPSGVVLGAFAEAVAAWSDAPSFTLAVIGSDRQPVHPQVNWIFGNFNTIYLLAVDGRTGSFEERTKRLQDRLRSDLEHRYFSGLRVLRELNRRAGGTSRALVPVFFNSVIDVTAEAPAGEAPPPGEELPASAIRTRELAGYVHVPQTVIVPTLMEGSAGELVCKWQGAEDLFPPGMIGHLLQGYQRLLRSLAEGGEAWREPALPLLPAEQVAEREPPGFDREPLVARLDELIYDQARCSPAALAVIDGEVLLTWGELCRRADLLAGRLCELGAHHDQPVAVVVERGWRQTVAIVAVLRSGAAVLPLDPALPCERLRRLLEHSGAALALTGAREPEASAWPAAVCRLAVNGLDGPAADPPAASGEAADLAYLFYELDCSDLPQPRGVLLEHGGLARTLLAGGRHLCLGPADRLLAMSPPGSARAVTDLLGSLLAGAAVVFPRPEEEGDPAGWAQLILRDGVTVWSSPPALADRLAAQLEQRPGLPLPLRLALLSGEPIPMGLPERLSRAVPGLEVATLAGAPEGSFWSTVGKVSPEVATRAMQHAWGRAVGGQRLHVLDGDLIPRPDWVTGELWLSGEGLARGYWRDEDATRASFAVHPRTGERLFRTGLAARFLPGGEFEILGRGEEHKVEASGRRIEPRRIEAALERHPEVRAAVVLPRRDPDGRTRLVATMEAPGTDTGALTLWLRDRLPSHMIPSALHVVGELPRTPDGRLDRAAVAADLPAPALPPDPRALDPLEEELAALWREILGVERLEAGSDFFALGGDSLLVVRLMARIGERYGLTQPLHAFFDRPTLEGLAALVRESQQEQETARAAAPLLVRLLRQLPWRTSRAIGEAAVPPAVSYGMRAFLVLWIGRTISGLGTGLGSFTLGVWVFQHTRSVTSLSMMSLAIALTGLLLGPFAGSIADRWDRRRILITTDLLSAALTLTLAALLLTGRLQTWHVYPFAIGMVALGIFQMPALTAAISTLVPRRDLARTSAMAQMGSSVTAMIAPLLAGTLIGAIGFHGVILIDVCTFLVSAATILPMRFLRLGSGAQAKPRLWQDWLLGWRYIRERPGLLSLLVLFGSATFSLGIVQVLLTPLILSFATPQELGTVNSAGAAGLLLGGLILTLWGGPKQRIWGIFGALVAQALILFLGGLEPNVALVTAAVFAFMLTGPFVTSGSQAIWQSKVALDLQGRVFAIRGLIASASLPLAYAVAGPLADRVFEPMLAPGGALAGTVGRLIGIGDGRGVGFLFMVMGAFLLALTLVSFLNPRLRRVEEELPDAPRPEEEAAAPAEGTPR